MHGLSKVVFALHDIGQAFMRNIEQIDERLNVTSLQQMCAYRLPCIILMIISWRYRWCRLIFCELIRSNGIILPAHTVQQRWRA